MNYDIIGDVHGHADVLVALLRKLGYRERAGAWRHPERTAVFLGDFIDRVFNGSARPLLLQLVEDRRLSKEDLDEIARLIREAQ